MAKSTRKHCETCGSLFTEYACKPQKYCSVKCVKRKTAITHGESRTRLYKSWMYMKARCKSNTPHIVEYYRARGIAVCDEWNISYIAFRDWALTHGYKDGLELDRIDNSKGYDPLNCRWATRVEQMRNTRKKSNAVTSKYKGVSWCANVGKWRVQLHENGKPIHCGLFINEVDAAHRYDECASRIYGEFASLNF